MKLNVSVSALAKKHKFEVGARVAAEYDKNSWFVGSVKKITPTGCRIQFDTGDNEFCKFANFRIVEVIAPKKIKDGRTYAEIKSITKALIEKAERDRIEEEKRIEAEKVAAKHERMKKREMERAKQRHAANKEQYREQSRPAVRLMKRWCEAYNATQEKEHNKFAVTFLKNDGSYGTWNLADKKVRIVMYCTDKVRLYAVPPYPNKPDGDSKADMQKYEDDVQKIDDVEWNKAEFEYDKFTMRRFVAFLHATAKKIGNRLKGLMFDPLANKDVAPKAPVAETKQEAKPSTVQSPIKQKTEAPVTTKAKPVKTNPMRKSRIQVAHKGIKMKV